jgi:hypothetical protein
MKLELDEDLSKPVIVGTLNSHCIELDVDR